MSKAQSTISSSVLRWLSEIPSDRPIALLLRHAARPDLPENDVGYSLPITDLGARLSAELGTLIRGRLRSLHSSPLTRCLQTAEQIKYGATAKTSIEQSGFLGDPGIYVENPQLAWTNWQSMGNESVMAHMASADHALPGMIHPDKAATTLVRYMLAKAGALNGLHVFVTHDVLLSVTIARFWDRESVSNPWPEYLEGAFFWENDLNKFIAFRENQSTRATWDLL